MSDSINHQSTFPVSSNTASNGNVSDADRIQSSHESIPPPSSRLTCGTSSELPFLVTHWLSNYGSHASPTKSGGQTHTGVGDNGDRNAPLSLGSAHSPASAVDRIHRAAAELAAAFQEIGAYGIIDSNPISPQLSASPSVRNQSYSELTRQWTSLPTTQLESLVQSSQSATTAAHRALKHRRKPLSVIHAAYERKGSLETKTPGHDCATAIDVDSNDSDPNTQVGVGVGGEDCILHKPALLTYPSSVTATHSSAILSTDTNSNTNTISSSSSSLPPPSTTTTTAPPTQGETVTTLAVQSDHHRLSILAAQSFRRYLDLCAKYATEEREKRDLHRSLCLQKTIATEATAKANAILSTHAASASTSRPCADDDSLVQTTGGTDRWLAQKLESERVSAQLGRKLQQIADRGTQNHVQAARSTAWSVRKDAIDLRTRYADPSTSHSIIGDDTGTDYYGAKSSSALSYLLHRQYRGGSGRLHGPTPTDTATTSRTLSRLSGSVIASRISHAATVSCHLFYPVYCLRFDRTGRYFVTGADDQLVKVFRLGTFEADGRNGGRRTRRPNDEGAGAGAGGGGEPEVVVLGDGQRDEGNHDEERCVRGAILVCTLRGHAAVITDIDVSSDNALLATASDDGDVRVWGMENGCPVAILRGHKNGANMVSWSVMTPFRLVTAGDDGLARMWDIREAALKRCAAVRSRMDYTLPDLETETQKRGGVAQGASNGKGGEVDLLGDQEVALPPLPTTINREGEITSTAPILPNGSRGFAGASAVTTGGVVEIPRADNTGEPNARPLLPDPSISIEAAAERNNQARELVALNQNINQPAPGGFIAGDQVDEGVRLLYKLQHFESETNDDNFVGAGTRSRRKDIRVVCLSRCSAGGHFATGSDDGVGRIWLDEDDGAMESLDRVRRKQDSCISEKASLENILAASQTCSTYKTSSLLSEIAVVPSTSRLLSCLRGHTNCITDIEYSHNGDRLLTASQKDGVVRVWSWGSETSLTSDRKMKLDGLRQIVIRLASPLHLKNAKSSLSRRRGRGGASAKSTDRSALIFCDLAIWTSDDLNIVTSQSCPLKETGTEITPGSHLLHVWDSRTGLCLIALPAAHNSSCPVLISHPLDSQILASAGMDGYLKVWNLDKGECIFSHQNELQYGAMERPNEHGNVCGYLDGNFSPDGLSLVLTDNKGRITLVDVLQLEHTSSSIIAPPASSSKASLPEWMKEQYFASDYYDLFYDASGYCIEVGSQQPPHLAPIAARCDHGGVPYPECVQRSFRKIRGPPSILELDVRLVRDTVRRRSYEVRREGGTLSQNVYRKAAVTYGYGTMASFVGKIDGTVLPNFHTSVEAVRRVGRSPSASQGRRQTGSTRSRNASGPSSSNFRWIDYDDMMREDRWRNPSSDEDEEEYYEAPRSTERPPSDDDLLDATMDNDELIELSDSNDSEVLASPHRRPQHRQTSANSSRSSRRPPPHRQRIAGRRLNSLATRSRRNNRRNLLYDDTDEDQFVDEHDSVMEEGDRVEEGVMPQRQRPTATARSSVMSRSPPASIQRDIGQHQSSQARRSRRNNNRRNSTDEDTDDDGDDDEEMEDEDEDDEEGLELGEDDDAEEEEITTMAHRPTRVSSRQQRVASIRRGQYEDNGSSDGSEVEEVLTRNNIPSGEYVKDYTALGHLFKLPSSGKINRDWVTRQECIQGWCGTKVYAPQVGDSIIYIPRAHYNTIKKQDIELPWKSWPTTRPWPVVRCKVKSIRYRFPYKKHYARGERKQILSVSSVVSILTLAITGVPEFATDKNFPWPSKIFIEREATCSIIFDVSTFTSQVTDFIIPETLYLWRLRSLENSWCTQETDEVIQVKRYFKHPGVDSDTTPFKSSNAEVLSIKHNDLTVETECHFRCSGYNSLCISYGSASDYVSPWEIDVTASLDSKPLPPCITTEQKKTLLVILDEIDKEEWIFFSAPVDTTRYVDYPIMIEVPMDFSIIRSRLELKFYTNVLSVAADVKLIRDNCMKYNGTDSDILVIADQMLQKFEVLFQEKMEHVLKPGVRVIGSNNGVDGDENDDNISSHRNTRLKTKQGHSGEILGVGSVHLQETRQADTRQLCIGDENAHSTSSNKARTQLANVLDTLTNIPGEQQQCSANKRSTRSTSAIEQIQDIAGKKFKQPFDLDSDTISADGTNDPNLRHGQIRTRSSRARMTQDSIESEVYETVAHSDGEANHNSDDCNLEEKSPVCTQVSRALLQSPDQLGLGGLCKIGKPRISATGSEDACIYEEIDDDTKMQTDSLLHKGGTNTRVSLGCTAPVQNRMRLRKHSSSVSTTNRNYNNGNRQSRDYNDHSDSHDGLCKIGKPAPVENRIHLKTRSSSVSTGRHNCENGNGQSDDYNGHSDSDVSLCKKGKSAPVENQMHLRTRSSSLSTTRCNYNNGNRQSDDDDDHSNSDVSLCEKGKPTLQNRMHLRTRSSSVSTTRRNDNNGNGQSDDDDDHSDSDVILYKIVKPHTSKDTLIYEEDDDIIMQSDSLHKARRNTRQSLKHTPSQNRMCLRTRSSKDSTAISEQSSIDKEAMENSSLGGGKDSNSDFSEENQGSNSDSSDSSVENEEDGTPLQKEHAPSQQRKRPTRAATRRKMEDSKYNTHSSSSSDYEADNGVASYGLQTKSMQQNRSHLRIKIGRGTIQDDCVHEEMSSIRRNSQTTMKIIPKEESSAPNQPSRRSLQQQKSASSRIPEGSKSNHIDKKFHHDDNQFPVSSLLSEMSGLTQESQTPVRRSSRRDTASNNKTVVNDGTMNTNNNALSSLPKTRSSQRKHNNVTTYCDISGSDLSDYGQSDRDNESTPPQKRKRQKQKSQKLIQRRRIPSLSKHPSETFDKKDNKQNKTPKLNAKRLLAVTKGTITSKKQRVLNVKPDWALPDLIDWPRNTVKGQEEIRKLALRILELLEKMDTGKYFYYPVVKSFPDLKETYLNMITTPMDFHTIKKERIGSYQVISDLQQDLILIFSNCCSFNVKGSDIWNYTFSLWNKLNDVFIRALKDNKMDIPRRFQNTSMV